MSYNTQTRGFNVETLSNRELVEASGMTRGGTAVLMRYDDNATSVQNFYLEMYDNAGAQLGPTVDLRGLATHKAALQNDFRILGLSNGNVLVAYNKNDTGQAGDPDAFFFVVDRSGQKVVNDVKINTLAGATLTRGLDLIELKNGNIAF